MNKKAFLFKIIGVLFLVIPFFINSYTYFRFFSIFIGILFLTIGILIPQKKKSLKLLVFPIFLFLLIYIIDFGCVFYLKRIPIIAYENSSETKFSTYDGLFYRIFNCNGVKTIDLFYKSNYSCDFALEPKEINAFLNNGANNYHKYYSKFITIKGKVSEIVGNDYLLLQAYEQNSNNLVGQLTFNKNATLKVVNNQENLKLYNQYEIYDNVLVTGKIVKKENNEIIMHDAKIEVINNFDNFLVKTMEEKNCKAKRKVLTKVGEYIYYSECLDKIYVTYDENTIYDLIFALETKKLTFDKWVKEVEKQEDNEKELYKFQNYNLLKCKNRNRILIGNKKLKLNSNFCENVE